MISGQIIIFHQPRFPWNKGMSLLNHHFGAQVVWGRYNLTRWFGSISRPHKPADFRGLSLEIPFGRVTCQEASGTMYAKRVKRQRGWFDFALELDGLCFCHKNKWHTKNPKKNWPSRSVEDIKVEKKKLSTQLVSIVFLECLFFLNKNTSS